jgi:hypothetical protein
LTVKKLKIDILDNENMVAASGDLCFIVVQFEETGDLVILR